MDVLYQNLDNYNEEAIIAELQTENKELKSKLEEYSVAMAKLQRDFDKLSSEYQRLELNYSSLLKTAKAEIERKTQMITNLNLEKDRMILKSQQNKNINTFKSFHCGSPIVQQNSDKGKNEMTKHGDKLQQSEKKPSPYPTTERSEKNEPSPKDVNTSSQTDLRSKLLNLAHGTQQIDSRADKNSDVKENIIELKKENGGLKSRAPIKNRRKSMPAISMETEQFSEDDVDLASITSSKNFQTNTECNLSEKQDHLDHNFRERPKSRISETSSLEEKKMEFHDSLPDTNKQRFSRYDRDKDDKYRVRHKSSHRYKRSPDRHHSGSRQYYDPYHRFEHDRYRAKGRISGSPLRDMFHQRPHRDSHRSNYDRNHPYEPDRRLLQGQERHGMKRRFEHGYDELETKRLRRDLHSKQLEEDRRIELDHKRHKMELIQGHFKHHGEDQRNKDDRKPVTKKYIDPLEIQFSSCESPDYDHWPDVSNQQVKEIKLTATTKLDDPRTSSKNYVLNKNDGHGILTTTYGRSVDLVPIKKTAWGIIPVSMPEALVNPPEPKHSAKHILKETDNPANVSIESGEILDGIIQNRLQKCEVNLPSNEKKEMPVLMTNPEENKDVQNSLKNILSYKIPKIRKSVDEKQSTKDYKEITSTVKHHDNISLKNDMSNKFDIKSNDIDLSKPQKVEEEKESEGLKQDSFVIQNEDNLPCFGGITSNVYEQRHPTAKEVVENDLQMSDDNYEDQSDNVSKGSILNTELKNKILDKDKNTDTEKQVVDVTDKPTLEHSKDKTSNGDTKKSKTKKKPKHKETKNVSKCEDLAKVFEKPTRKKEKTKDSKINEIKTKFTYLFDDSSSLILPEDLGLSSVPTPTTMVANKCVPFFEDALDADDLNRIKPDATKDSILSQKTDVENKPNSDVNVTKIDAVYPVSLEDSHDKSEDKSNGEETELTDDVIKSIYQNLEPGVSEEDNVVKTIIISTGVQPPILFEDEKQFPPNGAQLQAKNIQDLGLEALATSTPHKIWQPDGVAADTGSKLPIPSSSSLDSSQIDTATFDKSESNTVDSQISDSNVPDVRIFVKRRRKVIKK